MLAEVQEFLNVRALQEEAPPTEGAFTNATPEARAGVSTRMQDVPHQVDHAQAVGVQFQAHLEPNEVVTEAVASTSRARARRTNPLQTQTMAPKAKSQVTSHKGKAKKRPSTVDAVKAKSILDLETFLNSPVLDPEAVNRLGGMQLNEDRAIAKVCLC